MFIVRGIPNSSMRAVGPITLITAGGARAFDRRGNRGDPTQDHIRDAVGARRIGESLPRRRALQGDAPPDPLREPQRVAALDLVHIDALV